VDIGKAQQPHERATREDLKLCVTQSQQSRLHGTSAHQTLFEKTLSLYRAYLVHGCLGPADTSTTGAINKDFGDDQWAVQTERSRRGHDPKATCNGKLIFDYDHNGKAFVR
jgi:hypothetical protein